MIKSDNDNKSQVFSNQTEVKSDSKMATLFLEKKCLEKKILQHQISQEITISANLGNHLLTVEKVEAKRFNPLTSGIIY